MAAQGRIQHGGYPHTYTSHMKEKPIIMLSIKLISLRVSSPTREKCLKFSLYLFSTKFKHEKIATNFFR